MPLNLADDFAKRHRARTAAILAALLALPAAHANPEPADSDTPPARDTTAPTRLDELRTFSDMVQLIRDNYVDEIPESELLHQAMAGLVAGLDEHSAWLPPRDFDSYDDGARGRRGGIGAEFEIRDSRLFVSKLSTRGPAVDAGLQVGDQLLAVDDRPVRGRSLHRSLDAVAGDVGTTVTLRLRDAGGERKTIELERAWIPVESVSAQWLDSATAYLSISHFNDHSAEDFERELNRLAAEPGREMPARIIIDLRDNRGGVLPPALAIADGFLDGGLVVETRGRTPSTRMKYVAQPGQWSVQADIAVLVGPLTASASEILAGALQDHGRARVFGMNSFGKGTVQSVVRLGNGSALKFTTARYYTPSGRDIDASGIKPDITVEGGVHPVADPEDPVVAAALAAFSENGSG